MRAFIAVKIKTQTVPVTNMYKPVQSFLISIKAEITVEKIKIKKSIKYERK